MNMDSSIRAAAVNLVSVGRPGNSSAGWALLLLVLLVHSDLGEEVLLLSGQIPDLDTSVGGGSQPLVLGVEREGVDLGFALELGLWRLQVEVVPDLDDLVLTTGGDVHAVSGDVQSVDDGLVGLDGSNDSEDAVPDLEFAVPTDGSIVLGLGGLGESDSGDPVFVVVLVMWRLRGGDLALSQSVPQFDGFLNTGGENLSVVSGESAGEQFFVVANEVSDALAGSEIPKSHGLVPRRGHDKSVVVRDRQVTDEVRVTSQAFERSAGLAVDLAWVQVPDDKSLISGSGDQDDIVFISIGGGAVASDDRSDGVTMAVKDTNRFDTSRNF